jgi:hypothetical protein
VNETEDNAPRSSTWTAQGIARILGIIFFGLLFWFEHPPAFFQHEGYATYAFAILIWAGELLAYAIGTAGILVIIIFAGYHAYHLLRGARRWFRLQEIRSWRAKRACNFRDTVRDAAKLSNGST